MNLYALASHMENLGGKGPAGVSNPTPSSRQWGQVAQGLAYCTFWAKADV